MRQWLTALSGALFISTFLEWRVRVTDSGGYAHYYYGFPCPWWYDDASSSLDRQVYLLPFSIHAAYVFAIFLIFWAILRLCKFHIGNVLFGACCMTVGLCLMTYVYTFSISTRFNSGFPEISSGSAQKAEYSVKWHPSGRREY